MKTHLVWIRATAAAALAAVGVHPAAAQYAPFKPFPPQPVAPQATAPAPQYVAARPQPVYAQAPTVYTQAPPVQYQAQYQAPTAQYQAPVMPYQPQVAQYPQTAARYPATYGSTPYVAQAQPTEALPSPQAPAAAAPAPAASDATQTPVEPTASDAAAASANSGYPANCNCGPNGYAASGYGVSSGNSCGSYPEVGNYIPADCGPQNMWFGGVYWLFMNRDEANCQPLTVEVDHNVVPDPYYPMRGDSVLCTEEVSQDFRSGVEIRLGSTFVVGGSTCNTGCGYGYPGCGPSCSSGTMYAWEVAWWGIDDNPQESIVEVMPNMWMYGMKNFAGLEYNGGSGYRPVNDYYGYEMPIYEPGTPPADGTVRVLSQRVYSNFKAQNLELNFMRFGASDVCSSGCGGDACGGNSGCDASSCSSLSMYGSCGVRYFRIDDDLSYDTEFGVYSAGSSSYSQSMPDGYTMDNGNELYYDINVDNNLIGPQLGWTACYAVGCRWNFFLNNTFGIFDNHINVDHRVWSGGGGPIRFVNNSGEFPNGDSKDRVAFLGELRAGGSYDISCHWRAIAAYRVVAMTGIATAVGQFPSNFSDHDEVICINDNDSLVVHGLQLGAECRY